jgi:type II secretory pathway pseudopilin PulG
MKLGRLTSNRDFQMNEQRLTFNLQKKQGQSFLEIIIAIPLLVIIVSTTVVAVLNAFSTTRMAQEETKAAFYAAEGIAAVQSIRNQDWENLANASCSPTCGLDKSGGAWVFSGTADDPDGTAKFSRTAILEDVQRNDDWEMVESGGVNDEETKKITLAVSWYRTPTQEKSVTMATYLTDWQKGKNPTPSADCDACCQTLSYSSGTCRKNEAECTLNEETMESGCGQHCQGYVCCCFP